MTHPVSVHHTEAGRNRAPTLAALDLGTNNCRLLVARPHGREFDIVDSFSRIVRLGEGLASHGRLTEPAMARTMAALRVCAGIMRRHGVDRARCVATEACRRATNALAFLSRVKRATGIDLEILPVEQEARLALLGCMPLIDPDAEHVLLVDIGGGSTEFLWLDRTAGGIGVLRCATSIALGVVSLSEAFSDEPDAATYEAMVRHAKTMLAPVEARHDLPSNFSSARVQLLGTSGTVTTLAAVWLDLPRYDRRRIDGLTIETGAIGAVSQRLCGMSNAARAAHPCIGQGRADLVVAGCAILEAVLRKWPAERLRVADRGLREGILQGLAGRPLEPPMVVPPAGFGAFDALAGPHGQVD